MYASKKDSPNTLSSYAKEIERFLLWCIHVSDVGLTELTREDIVQYETFITDPEPYALWCGQKVARLKKDGSINPDWRPFFKPLGKSSSKKALKILDSLFSYLVEMHYLQPQLGVFDKKLFDPRSLIADILSPKANPCKFDNKGSAALTSE